MSSVLKKHATAEAWGQWVDGLHEALADAKRMIADSEPLTVPRQQALMRSFHLIKGASQALGLHGAQSVAHELESRVVEVLNDPASHEAAALREILESGVSKLDSVLSRLHELSLRSAARREMLPAQAEKQERLSDLFARIGSAAHGIATELGQRLVFESVGGEEICLAQAWEAPFEAALLHAVRNSLDHGARERGMQLQLRLVARLESGSLVIECIDSGAGIDPERVREAARARHARFDAEMGSLSDSEVLQLLFLPGLSLSRGVSRLSGRGYGLNIVREAIETRLNGRAHIESAPGQGTRLVLRIPVSAG